MKPLTVGSLFAGIGGFDLAFEAAGFELAWQVEIDEFCNKVLEKHWPTVLRFRDVTYCHGSIISSEDSPVRISRRRGSGPALTATAPASGANSSDLSENSSREVSCLRTSITRGGSGCLSCGAPCGSSGIPLCRFACAPVILGPGMSGVESSLWPTLTHQSYGSNRGGANGRTGKIRPSLPTLLRSDTMSRGHVTGAGKPKRSLGADPLAVILPTLTVCGNYNRKGASATSGDGLATAVGGRLNPTWCEWFMGFPLGWTDVAWPPASARSATRLSRQRSSGSRNGSKKRNVRDEEAQA